FDETVYYPVGLSGKQVLVSHINRNDLGVLNADGSVTALSPDLMQLILTNLDVVVNGRLNDIVKQTVAANETLTYSRCKIIDRRIPTVILLANELGLTETLRRAQIDYTIET